MDTFKRIAYLHQAQSLLNDLAEEKREEEREEGTLPAAQSEDSDHQPKKRKASSKLPLVKLNAFFGFLSKEIAMKHNVQILNSDEMRQFRCKRCFAQYNFHRMSPAAGLLRRSSRKQSKASLELTCPHCGFLRKVIFEHSLKTKYERLLAGQPLATLEQQQQPKKGKKNKVEKKKQKKKKNRR